jgi:hypothetical protein
MNICVECISFIHVQYILDLVMEAVIHMHNRTLKSLVLLSVYSVSVLFISM